MQEKNKRQITLKDEIVRKIIAKNLRKHRKKIGKTRQQIADIAGISLKSYDNIEQGSITVNHLLKILINLNLDPRRLLDQE